MEKAQTKRNKKVALQECSEAEESSDEELDLEEKSFLQKSSKASELSKKAAAEELKKSHADATEKNHSQHVGDGNNGSYQKTAGNVEGTCSTFCGDNNVGDASSCSSNE